MELSIESLHWKGLKMLELNLRHLSVSQHFIRNVSYFSVHGKFQTHAKRDKESVADAVSSRTICELICIFDLPFRILTVK